jgi:nitrile hydratase accessory protein
MPSDAIPDPHGQTPHFFAPWQARAFALTVHLHDQGHFSWDDWVNTFSARIGEQTAPDTTTSDDHAEVYYLAWLEALVDIVTERQMAEASTIVEMAETWRRAARATPHGTPIRYEAGLRD